MSTRNFARPITVLAVLALSASATASAVRAQAPEPGAVGELVHHGNAVGGAFVTMTGSGDDRQIHFGSLAAGVGSTVTSQQPRGGFVTGGTGDGPEVVYHEPAPASLGREAWLVGSGDDAMVTYRPER